MRRYLIIFTLLLTTVEISAQRLDAQGILMNRDIMMLSEMTNISQSSFQYGTARSMALSGAITSLGGDASSMMVNPAGLGMYRSTEFTFTPMVSVNRSLGEGIGGDNGDTPFALSNFAAVFNTMSSPKGKFLTFNIGLGANKISDYNYSYTTESQGCSSSIANIFSEQLTAAGVSIEDLYGVDYPNWDFFPSNLYGAALGYKGGLTSSDDNVWSSTWLNPEATVDQKLSVDSEGSAWEFDISMGGNIDNKLYFGATLGIQSIQQRIDLIYEEEYIGNSAYGGESDYLRSSYYSQAILTSGSGINAKFGVTYRPIESVRIGVSYHTPTYYNLDRSYQAAVGSLSSDVVMGISTAIAEYSPLLEDMGSNRWRYRSSGKLLAGASFTFAKRALIAFDYQLDQYGNTTIRNTPTGIPEEFYNAGEVYQDQHTFKVGLEFKPTPQVALRLGGAWSSDMIRDVTALYDMPTLNRTAQGSVGIGVALSSSMALDLTYMARYNEYSDYTIFYGESATAQSGDYWLDIWQHNIALTMSIRL
ncbi:MAG: hypothetical protein SNG35_03445 [Rikenellaceae bacterium]